VKISFPDLFNTRKVLALEQQFKAIQNFWNPVITANLSATVFGNMANNAPPIYPNTTSSNASNYYIDNDAVYSVVNKIAETTSLIPFYVYYETNDKALRKLKGATQRLFYTNKGLYDIAMLQVKALEDAPESDPLNKLLMSPNLYQSQQEFFLAAFCYYLLAGECFIFKFRGVNDVTELHILPPANVIVHVSREYPQVITSYELTLQGNSYKNIPPGDMIHVRKFHPDHTYGYDAISNYARFRGLSPLVPATKVLTRLVSADDAAVSQLQNGGLPGIVYDRSIGNEEVSQESLDLMRQRFFSYTRNSANKGAPFFAAGEKGYVPIGLPLADLEVMELQNMDFKRLCNIYKVSTILFNSDVAATESNVKEMVKQMYTSVCLPLAYTFRDKFNAELSKEVSPDKKRRFIDVDVSGITELQDDFLQLANVLAALPITPTGNEIRGLFKWDAIENDNMNIPLVKQGYSLIDELSFPMPDVRV